MQGLTIRKRAVDRSVPVGQRALRGIDIVAGLPPHRVLDADEAPAKVRISTTVVDDGLREGWITGTGHQLVTRPSGPAEDPWRGDPHNFHQFDSLTFHTLHGGDVTYRVAHQPDKYADHRAATFPDQVAKAKFDDSTSVDETVYAAGATRVDWFYDLTKEG
jgi:hypothetical protein